jgi:predicted TIM-barrel fold metal-dependent hydrolase
MDSSVPKIDIIDSQVHVFHHLSPAACLGEMDALGIQGAVIDELWEDVVPTPPYEIADNGIHRPLADAASLCARDHPDRFRYLRRVAYLDPELPTIVKSAAEDPMCLALRACIHQNTAADFANGKYRALFASAAASALPMFVLTYGMNGGLEPYIAEIGECQFILDHVGWVRTKAEWERTLRLSRYPNVSLKWCHPHAAFGTGRFPNSTLDSELKRAVEDFGPERIMWASDATVIRSEGITWSSALSQVRECELLTVDERAWVLGRSARTILRWPEVENARDQSQRNDPHIE